MVKARGAGIILLIVATLCLVLAGYVSADDYVPLPGIKSPEEVDFGGKTVSIVRHVARIFDENRIADAEKAFNCKIEVVNITTADQFISRILSGDSTYDIIREKHRVIHFPLVTAGLLYPVGDLLPDEHYEALTVMDRYSIEKLEYEGKKYGFGPYEGIYNDSMMLWLYNRDLLEQYGQPDPYDLWQAEQWTYDAFEEIAKAVTVDTDGNGMIDQWGVASFADSYGVYRFAPSNGVELAKQIDGKWVFTFDSKEAIEVLNYMKRWNVDLGLMGGNFGQGTAAFNPNVHLTGIRNIDHINYGVVPMPKGPSADRHYYPVFQFWMMSLPINAERPEDLMALGCYLFRTEDSYVHFDQDVNLYLKDRQHLEAFAAAIEGWRGEGDIFQNTDLWNICSVVSDVVRGQIGAAAAMDEIRPQAQAFLDDLFRQ